MKYKVGDRVRIKSIDWYNENKDENGHVACGYHVFTEYMSNFCGCTMIVCNITNLGVMTMDGSTSYWTDEMIEGLVEETKPEVDYEMVMNELMGLDIEKYCINNDYNEYKKAVEEHGFFSEEALTRKLFIHLRKIGTAQNVLENFGFNLPEDYVLKDENGNVINATKIVLEKKKKEYPKTYEECCEIIHSDPKFYVDTHLYSGTLGSLYKLLVCRDAYWKIAGEEMGLDKPWKPDWNDEKQDKHGFYNEIKNTIINSNVFVFPTAKMRYAFYDNFKKEIEICKEK